MKTIAKIYTDFPEKFGIPRQSGLVDLPGRIVFESEYRNPEGIRGIEGFSHLWLLWRFDVPEKEGFTAEHDAKHLCSELTDAAVMYAMRGYWKKRIDPMIVGTDEMPGLMWPFGIEFFKPSNEPWPENRIKDLVKAGALIAAEIDRLLNEVEGSKK